MAKLDREVEARLRWIRLYEESGDAGLVCRRCGISRPTLRKWWSRYREEGMSGLCSLSRRPKNSPGRKVTPSVERLILQLRRSRNLGPKRLQAELLRLHEMRLSTATIWKVLDRHDVKPLYRHRGPPRPKSYTRPVPGDRVQVDSMRLASGIVQFTALDDCTRMRVLGLYERRTAGNAAHFLEERVLEELPFPIQRVQTDRGGEFFGLAFQCMLRKQRIRFRPLPPASPHLNGKVERSQQTDRVEFWPTVALDDPELRARLEEWQFFYNWYRPHSTLNGQTPIDRCCDLLPETPTDSQVFWLYNSNREPYREREFALDQKLKNLRVPR